MSTTIRMAHEHDADGVLEVYAPAVRDTAISFEYQVPTADEMRRRIRAVNALGHWLVASTGRDDGARVLGYAYASTFRDRAAYRWTAESAVYVHAGHQRRGVARALYTALFAGLRMQGFRSCIAGVTLPNPASVCLHESFGFRPVGVFHGAGYKNGSWHDVGFWERSLTTPDASTTANPPGPSSPSHRIDSAELDPPAPVTPASALERDPAWIAACATAAARIRA